VGRASIAVLGEFAARYTLQEGSERLVFNDATIFGDYFHGRIAMGLRDLREAFLIKRAESYECVCPRLRVANKE